MLFEATLSFIWIVYFFETYLDIRQHRKLLEKKIPQELENIVPEEKFLKSQSYQLEKSNFGFVHCAVSIVETTLIQVLGGFPLLWAYSTELASRFGYSSDYEVTISLLFVGIGMVYQMITSLPFELYSTFVIEERHGFNKQTLSLFFIDKLKGILVGVLILVPTLSTILHLIKWGGSQFYLYVWGFLLAFTMIMMIVYPNFIAPLFNKFEPLGDGELRTAIEQLAAKIHFPLKKIFVVDGSKRSGHSNAYFYGIFKEKRIVLFDTLIKQMDIPEMVAVLGHELGHWKMSHVIKMFAISQVQIFVSFFLFGQVVNSDLMYQEFGFDTKPTLIGLMLFFSCIMTPIDHVLSFLMNILSRKFEFQADAFSKDLGYALPLRTGLIKLNIENLGNMNPDSLYSNYHYSHPPVMERLKALARPKTD